MFDELNSIHSRPQPFEFYTTDVLWTDVHTSKQMLSFHLDETVDAASRNTAFIDFSVDWIVSRFAINGGMRIADFGCGPGLYTTRFARLGARVTGIDFSERSIEYARGVAAGEKLSIDYEYTDYLAYRSDKRFDLITMIMCDFCALSPAQRRTLLDIFHAHLTPGGSVLLDGYTITGFDTRKEMSMCEENLLDGFWSSNPYYGFLNIFKYDAEKVILDKYTIIEQTCTRTVYNWLQYFSPETLEHEFNECGFGISEYLADVAGTPFNPSGGEFALVASPR